MVAVMYNARERRLVLDGPCRPSDDRGVARAIREHAEPDRSLVLDLTRLTRLPDEVARAIDETRRAVEPDGCWVSVWAPVGATRPPVGGV